MKVIGDYSCVVAFHGSDHSSQLVNYLSQRELFTENAIHFVTSS
jgi:hypothetical protein